MLDGGLSNHFWKFLFKKIFYYGTADQSPEFHLIYLHCWMQIHKTRCKNKPQIKARVEEMLMFSPSLTRSSLMGPTPHQSYRDSRLLSNGHRQLKIPFHAGHACMLSHVQLLATPWTISLQAPLVHGILQARIPEWVTISSSRGSSPPRGGTCVFFIGRQVLYHWATWEAPSSKDDAANMLKDCLHSFNICQGSIIMFAAAINYC